MDLINIEHINENDAVGYVRDDDNYIYFHVKKGESLVSIEIIPISEYDDYGHFAAVMGKFDPFNFFFEKPIVLKSSTYNGIKEAYEKHLKGREVLI